MLRQVVRRHVEVNILVVIAAEEIAQVERAAHGEESRKAVGMAQRDVDRVIAAKAAAERNQMRVEVAQADERQHLFHHVVLVLNVARDAPARRNIAVVPALGVDAVDAITV